MLYALIALVFLTGVGGKRVVAAPVFSPYQAALPSAAITTELIKVLTTPPGSASGAAQNESLLLPDLEILEPFDIHTVGSQEVGDLRLKFGTMIWNAGTGPLETRGAENPGTKQLEVYQYLSTHEATGKRSRANVSAPSTTTIATVICTCKRSPVTSSGR